MTELEKKEAKRLYDIEYRRKNREKIKHKKKKYYEANKSKINEEKRKKRDNDNARAKHAEFCRRPEQRYKERIRRYVRIYGADWEKQTKYCVSCDSEKHFMKFGSCSVFPDGRRHICDECEDYQNTYFGCSTRATMNAIVNRKYTKLTRYDIAKYPYLIEANKFLILLKQQLK